MKSEPLPALTDDKGYAKHAAASVLSARMRRIRKTDTKPEMVVRRLAHGMGYRYRLHCRDLQGTPDLVFRPLHKVIFVHGCFWHQHDCPLGRKQPSTNTDYWLPKLARNVQRDRATRASLQKEGWQVLVVWECQTRAPAGLPEVLSRFLQSSLQGQEPDGMPSSRREETTGTR